MGPYLLILFTMNPRTGDVVETSVVGDPYDRAVDCIQAAIDKGPMKVSDDGNARYLVCRQLSGDTV